MSIYCMYTKADGCVLNTEGIRDSSLWLTCGHSHQLFLSSKDYAQQARMCMVPLYNKLFSAIVTVPFSRMTTLFSYMPPPLRCDLTLTHTLKWRLTQQRKRAGNNPQPTLRHYTYTLECSE